MYNLKPLMKVDISVVIATKDRPKSLEQCINSLIKGTVSPTEIILVDQSLSNDTEKIVSAIKLHNIIYISTNHSGKANAINLGLSRISNPVVAFTDDDCKVSRTWLANIWFYLKKHKNVAGVFGSTLPFEKKKHTGKICLATFYLDKDVVVNNPYLIHYHELGLGNNMSFRASVIKKVGPFKSWLGPGKPTVGGEDSEYIYRTLKHGYELAYSPKIVIFHNNWVSYHEEQMHQCLYTRGAVAFSFYYVLTGDFKISSYIVDRLKNRIINKSKDWLRPLIRLRVKPLYHRRLELLYAVLEVLNILFGMILSLFALVNLAVFTSENNKSVNKLT